MAWRHSKFESKIIIALVGQNVLMVKKLEKIEKIVKNSIFLLKQNLSLNERVGGSDHRSRRWVFVFFGCNEKGAR